MSGRGLAVASSLVTFASYIGMIFLPQYMVAWTVVGGLAIGFCFPLALSFFVTRASNARQAAALSGMAQSVGYGIAAMGPVLFGALHDWSHGWVAPLWMMVACSLVQIAAGWHAGRKGHVGDAADVR